MTHVTFPIRAPLYLLITSLTLDFILLDVYSLRNNRDVSMHNAAFFVRKGSANPEDEGYPVSVLHDNLLKPMKTIFIVYTV